MIKKVAFIGYPTRDINRARKFYGDLLGLKNSADFGEVWSEFDTPEGKSIALDTFSPQFSDAPTPYLALETDDIEAEVAHLREGGATILRDVWTNQTENGQEICKMAMVLDSEANPLMLHQIAPDRAKG